MYAIRLASKRVQKELDSLPKPVYQHVEKAILALKKNPRPRGSVKLVGSPVGDFRLRIGGYRVIYDVYDKIKEVVILKVAKRSRVYRIKG